MAANRQKVHTGNRVAEMTFKKSDELRHRSHALIPGGAHTYAKGDDQYPVESPGFIARGLGSHVWDIDGNEFIEYGMGLRSVTLGHAFEAVVAAAERYMRLGTNFVRPAAIEIECAESLLSVIPGGEMVKFAKNGSDVTTAAVKLARAYTKRDLVAVCEDHPFFSVDDWFIGTTAMSAGIPQAIRDLSVSFHYDDIESVRALFENYPDQIACLIMELEADCETDRSDFVHGVRRLCTEHGAILIFDEIITGFRYHLGGAQALVGVTPDLSTFGKALGNGFSIAALVGKKEIMELGGLLHDKERVFLLSTTFGAETHSLAAAQAVIQAYHELAVIERLREKGQWLIREVTRIAEQTGVQDYFGVLGHPANLIYYTLDPSGKRSQPFRSLFLQETIRRGLLMPSLVVSYAHSEEDLERTVEAIGEALLVYRKALDEGPEKYLRGRSIAPVFRKKNLGIVGAQLRG